MLNQALVYNRHFVHCPVARLHLQSVHTDFTGVWKLIRGESDFGFLPTPHLRIDRIVHQDPQLHIRTRQKDANGDITIDRDLTIGEEASEIIIRGRGRRVRAFWDEAVLVVETSSEVSGKGRRIEDRWTLDPGADWLTIERRHEQPGGPVRQRLRLRRRQDRVGSRSATVESTLCS